MAPSHQGNTADAIVAVATRLTFYRQLQQGLDDWLRENPMSLAEYRAATAQVDSARLRWEAELDALSQGMAPIAPPSAQEVSALRAAVERLNASVAAARAVNDFLEVLTEAAEAFQEGTGA